LKDPFSCALYPSATTTDGTGIMAYPTPPVNLVQTLRESFKTSDCFEEDRADWSISWLMDYETNTRNEGFQTDLDSEVPCPTMWVLNDVLPTTNPFLLDQLFWKSCLESAIVSRSVSVDACLLSKIIRHCEASTIRSALIEWADILQDEWRQKEAMLQIFRLLAERPEDTCFIGTPRRDINREQDSPLSLAVRRSLSFSRFRDILKLANFDIEGLVRKEVEIHNTGWTEKSLLSLFMSSGSVVPVYMFTCRRCKEQFRSYSRMSLYKVGETWVHVRKEVSWERRLRRLKRGIDPEAPLNEMETREQKEGLQPG
jgi:hypothetical protein